MAVLRSVLNYELRVICNFRIIASSLIIALGFWSLLLKYFLVYFILAYLSMFYGKMFQTTTLEKTGGFRDPRTEKKRKFLRLLSAYIKSEKEGKM